MDKDELKRILHEQFEPLQTAVQKKLDYLQSDNVFADDTYRSVIEDNPMGDDSLANAFNSNTTAQPIPAYKPTLDDEYNTYSAPKASPERSQLEEHKHNIAARIAALRGISMPGDYIKP